MTYLYDRVMHCPNVETIAKRRGTAQHATSLRNRRTNRNNHISDIRRGRPVCLPDIKGSTHRSTPTVLLIIFFVSCMLFGLSDARAQSPKDREAADGQVLRIPEGGIVIGDSLPEAFWQQELTVINHPYGKNTVKLSEYRQQLLVLDFLNTACVPCIHSVD